MIPRILVVDDEGNIRDLLTRSLTKKGYEVLSAPNGREALEIVGREVVDIALVDVRMPVMDGMEFLRRVKEAGREITVIMMSAYGTYGTVVEAIREGAYDYIQKPFEIVDVLSKIEKITETRRLLEENERLRREIERRYSFEGMVGKSKAMKEVFSLIEKVRDYSVTVLIQGESGTGKELVARSLHFGGARRRGPFVVVNCAAIPENLIEAELFGYRKGAFTDAVADKKGLIEESHGGTLFLDEIGELPLTMQSKILRVLQEGEVRRIGDVESRKVDFRVVAATSKNLPEEVRAGRFREDLYYRLNRVVIQLPPLRDRKEDIPLLAEHFLKECADETGKKVSVIREDAMKLLLDYYWPGNVRELRNVIERAVLLAEESEVTAELVEKVMENDLVQKSAGTAFDFDPEKVKLRDALKEVEKMMIEKALMKTGGSRPRAAKLLGISHPALLYKIKEYGIN